MRMKTNYSKIGGMYITVFLLLTVLVYPAWQLLQPQLDTENYENRNLAEMPTFSLDAINTFPQQFETYVNDHLPFRNQLIQLNNTINYSLPRVSYSDQVAIGKNGWLFYTVKEDGDPIACYRGTNLLSDEQLQLIASNLTTVRDDLATQGTEFVLFIAPNKERIYWENMPGYYGEPAEEYAVKQIVDYLQEHTDLRVVYPIEELLAAKEALGDKKIYHKTDTHWNKLGGYIGACALLKELGITMPSYDSGEVVIHELDDVPGDLAKMLNIGWEIYPGKAYMVDGYETHGLVADQMDPDFFYHATGADPRKLMILRDSFCYAMADVLASQFDESVMIHRANYSHEMIAEQHPDVYVSEVVERYAIGKLLDINSIY